MYNFFKLVILKFNLCIIIFIYILYVCMYIPLFLCMFFGVCLLCVGVKTDTKRDVALQREKHQKGEGGTRALSDFSSVHKENHKKERAKTETLLQKGSNSILFNVHVCVFNAHFYTSP